MLTGVNASVKSDVLHWFNETLGVKQGDPAGPRVFVTYIHDLSDALCCNDASSKQHATFLINQIVKCLLWADDLVLISTNAKHMQAQVNALDSYCIKNKLHVNTKKIKSMYISTRCSTYERSILHQFTYRNIALEYVDRYKYIGVWTNSTGSLGTQVFKLLKILKATTSMYLCKNKSRRIVFRCPPKLRTTLFKAYM